MGHLLTRTWRILGIFLFLTGFLVILILPAYFPTNAQAFSDRQIDNASPTPQPTQQPDQAQLMSIGNDTCLSCHGQPGTTLTLENGEELDLTVKPDDYHQSIHGSLGYACVQCHTNVGNYPHPPFTAQDRRDVTLQLYPACKRCHASQFALTEDSVHAAALASGNTNAAVCTDCHTAHHVRQLTDQSTHKLLPDARVWIPQTCAQCHHDIYEEYLTSVHGSALVGEGNPDVPTCIDCHGVHNIENPTTASFRLKSPDICAKCHTDPKIMNKYGISTQVLNTYVADFHGTTVELFKKESPDAPVNKPVCFDCHGVHDIARVDDPQRGLEIKQNLLSRCRVCHPDASANFPTAWLSHYIPSPDKYPIVYYVNLFYKFFIPTVLGGMAILVGLDLNKLIMQRWSFRRGAAQKEGPAENESIPNASDPKETTPPTSEAGANPVTETLDTPPEPSSPPEDLASQTGEPIASAPDQPGDEEEAAND